jgi:transcriptional regulator with XRE-family HTH domain
MDTLDALRNFLISRRARLRPQDVGLPDHGVRRVRGLRREEVATLAAVSVEHYIRLERGQASRVSDAVLDAVAEALRLSTGERRCLRSLARPSTGSDHEGSRSVRPSVQHMLDSMAGTPAYLVGRRGSILAWNRLATAVFADTSAASPPQSAPSDGSSSRIRVPGGCTSAGRRRPARQCRICRPKPARGPGTRS